MKRDARTCLDDETIAAFIDGRLDAPARARVVEHLADCADCYFIFSESARASAASGMEARPHGFRAATAWLARPRVMWPGVGALAAAAVLVLAVMPLWRSASPPGLRALVAAVGAERTVEARMTGGFAYGPLKVTRGAASETSSAVRLQAATIEKAADERRTPPYLDALGVAHLVTGRPADAVTALESATHDAPNDARYWSDLSAAYLARGRTARAPGDFASALDAAVRATALAPTMPEAWFNRALAIEQIPSMHPQVKAAWDDYLKIDGQSGWAAEARQHIDQWSR
jgi:tetratricopeptide (TPR) repeat protein